MARGDLTDEEWAVLEGLLPSERGRKARPAHDNRRFLNGMLHVLRVGCPWRDMHERYGKWNSVYPQCIDAPMRKGIRAQISRVISRWHNFATNSF